MADEKKIKVRLAPSVLDDFQKLAEMPDYLVDLSKEGLRRPVDRDGNYEKFVTPERALELPLTVAPGTTLVDVAKVVDSYGYTFQLLIGSMAHLPCAMKFFHDEAYQALPTPDSRLVFQPRLTIEDGILESSLDFFIEEKGQRYGIGFQSLKEYAGSEILLDVEVLVVSDCPELREFKLKRRPTLREVLVTLYYEIGFHGSPEKRDEFAKHLKEMSEAIEAGTIETISLEEVFPELGKNVVN